MLIFSQKKRERNHAFKLQKETYDPTQLGYGLLWTAEGGIIKY